jgi:hypothetical protein
MRLIGERALLILEPSAQIGRKRGQLARVALAGESELPTGDQCEFFSHQLKAIERALRDAAQRIHQHRRNCSRWTGAAGRW